MNLSEFETHYRSEMNATLNKLQTAVMLVAQLEALLTNIGQNLQNFSLTVEEFITQLLSE